VKELKELKESKKAFSYVERCEPFNVKKDSGRRKRSPNTSKLSTVTQ
jgi:hypothetical protein